MGDYHPPIMTMQQEEQWSLVFETLKKINDVQKKYCVAVHPGAWVVGTPNLCQDSHENWQCV